MHNNCVSIYHLSIDHFQYDLCVKGDQWMNDVRVSELNYFQVVWALMDVEMLAADVHPQTPS